MASNGLNATGLEYVHTVLVFCNTLIICFQSLFVFPIIYVYNFNDKYLCYSSTYHLIIWVFNEKMADGDKITIEQINWDDSSIK